MSSIKKHLITGSLLIGTLVAPALVLADDTAATPVATPTPLAWYQKVTVGGYIDEYYQHSFNNPTGVTTGGIAPRSYDGTANQFTFGGGELTLKQNDTASGTGYFVDLLMGSIGSVYGNTGSLPDSVSIGQAYITQTLGNATFTLGKFGTPVGYEVTYLPSNANFSRSLLYGQEPTFNTGLRLDYTLPGGLTASGFIDNGNSIDNAITSGKDYGAILAYSGMKNLNLTGLWYLNNDDFAVGLPAMDVQWANFIATFTATDSFTLAGEYLFKEYVAPQSATGLSYYPIQQGYALYATFSPMPNWSFSPRFEQWFNPNALFTPPVVTNDYTLTAKYQMGPLAHMLEYRMDATNQSAASYYTIQGSSKPAFLSDIQQTLTYAAVYSF